MTLTEFLLARIAEDEAWDAENPHFRDAPDWVPQWWTRVLAECDAKRRIVAEYEGTKADDTSLVHEDAMHAAGWEGGLEFAIQALALPYANHPDYKPEWRP